MGKSAMCCLHYVSLQLLGQRGYVIHCFAIIFWQLSISLFRFKPKLHKICKTASNPVVYLQRSLVCRQGPL